MFLRQAGHYEQLLTLINMYFSVSIKHFDNDLIEKFFVDSSDEISNFLHFFNIDTLEQIRKLPTLLVFRFIGKILGLNNRHFYSLYSVTVR